MKSLRLAENGEECAAKGRITAEELVTLNLISVQADRRTHRSHGPACRENCCQYLGEPIINRNDGTREGHLWDQNNRYKTHSAIIVRSDSRNCQTDHQACECCQSKRDIGLQDRV